MVLILLTMACAEEGSISQNSSSSVTGYGTVTGRISDASTGANLASASVYVSGYASTTSTESANDGTYTISGTVPAGSVTVIASKTGYVDGNKSVSVTANGTTSNVDIALVPTAFGSGKFVVVLTWGQNPTDLDSHLCVSTVPYEVKYSATGDISNSPFAALDVDDTTSYGPETTTIKKNNGSAYYNGTYTFWVHKYSATSTLAASEALVKVYDDNSLVKSISVPTSGTGDYWKVFTLSGNTVTDVSTIQAASPTCP